MRYHRRITVKLLALAIALVPVTCVCAGTFAMNESVQAAMDASRDCHSRVPIPDVAGDESCTDCGDGAPRNVSKIQFDTLDLAPFGVDIFFTDPIADVRLAADVDHRRKLRQSTPVTLNVVLLS